MRCFITQSANGCSGSIDTVHSRVIKKTPIEVTIALRSRTDTRRKYFICAYPMWQGISDYYFVKGSRVVALLKSNFIDLHKTDAIFQHVTSSYSNFTNPQLYTINASIPTAKARKKAGLAYS